MVTYHLYSNKIFISLAAPTTPCNVVLPKSQCSWTLCRPLTPMQSVLSLSAKNFWKVSAKGNLHLSAQKKERKSASPHYFNDEFCIALVISCCSNLSKSYFHSPWNERWLHNGLPPLNRIWSYPHPGATRVAAECVHAEGARSFGNR